MRSARCSSGPAPGARPSPRSIRHPVAFGHASAQGIEADLEHEGKREQHGREPLYVKARHDGFEQRDIGGAGQAMIAVLYQRHLYVVRTQGIGES